MKTRILGVVVLAASVLAGCGIVGQSAPECSEIASWAMDELRDDLRDGATVRQVDLFEWDAPDMFSRVRICVLEVETTYRYDSEFLDDHTDKTQYSICGDGNRVRLVGALHGPDGCARGLR